MNLKAPYLDPSKKLFSYWKLNGLVLLSYVILTIILTYPVAFTIGTSIPGGGGDAFQWMNTLWYTNYALSHPDFTTLTYNNMIFYPTGIPVMPFSSAFNQVITLLLLPFCQIQVVYSIIWLLSFVLAAFGMYLLVRYLTQNDYAAFLSGIIFAFAPYHFAHGLGHLGATTVQWIPFCALFFMKVFREGGTKNCILAGIFYIFVAMSDLQYLVFMGIFIGLLFLYEHAISFQSNKGFNFESHASILIKYLITGIIAFSVILPLTITDIQVATSGYNFIKLDPSGAIAYSTDFLSFFLPSPLHTLFGRLVLPIYTNFTVDYSGSTTYIGYSVLLLAIFALYTLWKDSTVRFWGIIAGLFTLFSLGPLLHVMGKSVFTVFNTTVPLPYILLYYFVPFMDNSRTSSRIFVVAALAFGVLAGYGYSEFVKKSDNYKIIIAFLVGALIIFEYLSIPYPVSNVDQPEFYRQIGQDPEQFALLEIPLTANYGAGTKIMYYQTLHGKPLVGGWTQRIPQNARYFEEITPYIHEITYIQPSQDIIDQNVSEIGNSILSYYHIRYVVLHTGDLTESEINYLNSTLSVSLGQPVMYQNDSLMIYQVTNTPLKPVISSIAGWYDNETASGIPTRWMSSDANVSVYSDENQTVIMNMTTVSFYRPRTLDISLAGRSQQQVTVPETGFIGISIPLNLTKGENIIQLHALDGCQKPIDIPELYSPGSRCLSIAVRNITLI
jgi:hypothetical protein